MNDLPETDGGEYDVDFRADPGKYEIGRGEEGVFKCQPYKDELLPLWRYADRETADEAGDALFERFREYVAAGEFVGADLARKYLRMGYTRAMRYARYPGGRKYDDDGTERDPVRWADHDKREAALVFELWWRRAERDDEYAALRDRWESETAE